MTRVLRLLAVLVGGLLMLSACSTGPTQNADSPAAGSSSATGGAEADAFPVTIKHAFGETTIEKEPTRVATVGWTDQDMALSLGVVPVGATKVVYGGNAAGSTTWFDAKLKELGGTQPTRYDESSGINFDAVAQVRPDVILATNSGLTKADYDKLVKIAPVVAYPDKPWGTSWEESLKLTGQALGRPAKAAQVEADTKTMIADEVAKHPAVKGKTVMFASVMSTSTSKISLYTQLDNRPRLLTELGMVQAPIVDQLNTNKDSFFVDVSAEQAPKLAADVVMSYEDKPGIIAKDAVLSQIPAVKKGALVEVTDAATAQALGVPSPLSIPTALQAYLPKLDAAAQKAG